jgi:predicted transcriptional regulator
VRTHESPTEVSRCGVVRDWMTHRPVTVPEDCPIGAALGHMRAAGVRHLVVTDGDRSRASSRTAAMQAPIDGRVDQ